MTLRIVSRNIFALLGAFALLSCAAPPAKQTFAETTWSHLPPFKFNAAKVDVVSVYKPTFKPPYVEHEFETPPERMIRRWAQDRIVPAGPQGYVKVVINDASVKEIELEHPKDFSSHFTTEQGQQYDAVVDVTIEIYGPRGFKDGFTNARAERTQTIAEDATLNDRDRLWHDLVEGTMQDFNAQMETNINTYLQRFLIAR